MDKRETKIILQNMFKSLEGNTDFEVTISALTNSDEDGKGYQFNMSAKGYISDADRTAVTICCTEFKKHKGDQDAYYIPLGDITYVHVKIR